MDSKLFRLSVRNFLNGLVVAVVTAVLLALQAMITNPDFSIFTMNISDLESLLNVGLLAGGAYLLKKLASTEDGKFVGKI